GDMQAFYFEPTAAVRRLLEAIKHHLSLIETEYELSEIYYFIRELYYNSGNSLVWLENSPDVRICISKKDIRWDIAELLYQAGKSTILTSATISSKQDGTPQERCSYFLDSIGYPEIGMVSESKQSPYDYDHNTMLYCSALMPFPKHERREEYLKASIPEIVKLLNITNGKALILFTSKTDMEYVYKKLSNMHLSYRILMQSRTSSQEYQLNKFRNDVNSVLLGTGTYWEGINVEGESLSHVIIYTLPFPVPDPIIDYKMSLTEYPINDVAVPEMITKLRQGAGRLIRSANDKGIVSILDPRVSSNSRASYAKRTLRALPMKNRTENMAELQEFWDRIS
ncbi:MAG: ATP-dependent DNA helicase, partial [Oscillospiraceae bacterium]|nr:ATP-dependent DNA helicase [Oscillospiraceae bacterium]